MIDVVINETDALFVADPEHGNRVVFEVCQRQIQTSQSQWSHRVAERFVVQLKGSTGNGFGQFVSFEKACRSALWRARRYERAYSVPRSARAA